MVAIPSSAQRIGWAIWLCGRTPTVAGPRHECVATARRPASALASTLDDLAIVQRLGLEAVAEAGVGVDVAAVGDCLLELRAELADVDVDGAVAGTQLASPDCAAELRAGDDPACLLGHCDEQLELAYRQRQHLAPGTDQPLFVRDLEIVDPDRARVLRRFGHRAQARAHRATTGEDSVIRW